MDCPPTALPRLALARAPPWAGRDLTPSVPGDPPQQLIDNQTRVDKYFVVSGENSSELHVQNLHLEQDPGKYSCEATNSEGHDSATIELRVRKHLAALWPFLGIVAEVLVLVTIIFVYEKRQKKDDQVDGEVPTNPPGGAPLSVRGCWDPGRLPNVPGWQRLWRQHLGDGLGGLPVVTCPLSCMWLRLGQMKIRAPSHCESRRAGAGVGAGVLCCCTPKCSTHPSHLCSPGKARGTL